MSIDFEGVMLDIPDDVKVPEVEFLIENLIRGLLFQEDDNGEGLVPFDDDTLVIKIRPTLEG